MTPGITDWIANYFGDKEREKDIQGYFAERDPIKNIQDYINTPGKFYQDASAKYSPPVVSEAAVVPVEPQKIEPQKSQVSAATGKYDAMSPRDLLALIGKKMAPYAGPSEQQNYQTRMEIQGLKKQKAMADLTETKEAKTPRDVNDFKKRLESYFPPPMLDEPKGYSQKVTGMNPQTWDAFENSLAFLYQLHPDEQQAGVLAKYGNAAKLIQQLQIAKVRGIGVTQKIIDSFINDNKLPEGQGEAVRQVWKTLFTPVPTSPVVKDIVYGVMGIPVEKKE